MLGLLVSHGDTCKEANNAGSRMFSSPPAAESLKCRPRMPDKKGGLLCNPQDGAGALGRDALPVSCG